MIAFAQQIVNGLMIGSAYAVVALGFGLAYGVIRVCNMVHSEFFMMGAYVTMLVGAWFGITAQPPSVAAGIGLFLLTVAVVFIVMTILALALERLVVRPTRDVSVLIPFLATAAVSTTVQFTIQRIFGADPLPVPSLIPTVVFDFGGIRVTSIQLLTLVIGGGIMVGLSYYISSTKLGRAMRAVAERHQVAAACGVPVNQIYRLTLAISAIAGGVAGVSVGMLYNTAGPFMGSLFGLKSFICVLVAGNRRIEGVMVVGMVLGVIESIITGYVSSTLRDAVAFGILLVVLVVRPAGLFGSYED